MWSLINLRWLIKWKKFQIIWPLINSRCSLIKWHYDRISTLIRCSFKQSFSAKSMGISHKPNFLLSGYLRILSQYVCYVEGQRRYLSSSNSLALYLFWTKKIERLVILFYLLSLFFQKRAKRSVSSSSSYSDTLYSLNDAVIESESDEEPAPGPSSGLLPRRRLHPDDVPPLRGLASSSSEEEAELITRGRRKRFQKKSSLDTAFKGI